MTLPMIAGIGKAPTAVLDANAAALPLEYRDTILASTWGEHNLTLYRTRSKGASITASQEVWIEGRGHDDLISPFRPSGMAASQVDGSIYVSDWMRIDYTTHQRGRIWRISAKPNVPTSPPRQPYAPQTKLSEEHRLRRLMDADTVDEFDHLRQAIRGSDPFERSSALGAMARPVFRNATIRALTRGDAKVLLGALLALRRADVTNPESYIVTGLKDPDLAVVQMAMIWAGEKELRQLIPEIDTAAARAALTEQFF